MWVWSLGWTSVFGASILFARSEHPFLGLRYFWIHTFPSPESCDWRSIEFPAFPPSLAKELLAGTPPSVTMELSAADTHSQPPPPWSFSWRINKATCLIWQLFHTSTHSHTHSHTHTHRAWCCLVSLSPPLLVILYQLRSQSKEKVRREIACAYATVKNLNIGHMSD